MNRQVRSIGPNKTVREAARLMLETGLHSLPVVETTGHLLGMLTRADLLQIVVTSPVMSPQASSLTQPLRHTGSFQTHPLQEQPVSVFLQTDVPIVGEETPLDEVIDVLMGSALKRVLVVNREQQLQGIISDVDILTRVQAQARLRWLDVLTGWARGKPGHLSTSTLQTQPGKARIAREVMNSEVVSVFTDATVQEAVEIMLRTGKKFLPALDRQGHVQGVVGRSDLLRLLLEG